MTTADNPDFTIPAPSADSVEIPEITDIPADDVSFKDLKLLGMGGMGIVYEAEDHALERKVALKMLRSPYRNDNALVKKFIKEARITARIDHPNIIAVHHLGVNKDCGTYFSMRRINGETLQSIIRKLRSGDENYRNRYPLRRLLDIFIASCNGVNAAHLKNILHCDLKPSNIMAGDRGEVWVLDWGVAREKNAPDGETVRPNTVEGTVAFMAPELIRNTVDAPDKKTDIYALGTLLYCILTWRDAPYQLDMEHEKLVHQVASGKYLPLEAPDKSRVLPAELAAICRKAMSADREQRYDSVTALIGDIYNYLDNRPVSAHSPNPFYRLLKLCRRRPLIPVTVMAALLTLVVYHAGIDLFQSAENRSRISQAYSHIQSAYDHNLRCMRRWRYLTSSENNISPLKTALTEHEMLLSANYAMQEMFFAFDAVSGASGDISESFAAADGGIMLKRLLRQQALTATADSGRNILEQIQRRWPHMLEAAVTGDPELQKLVSRIKSSSGTVQFAGDPGGSPLNCTVIYPDGRSKSVTFTGDFTLELPAGDNRIFISAEKQKTVSAFFRITPGMNIRFSELGFPVLPEYIMVPEDHWFTDIPGLGGRLKRLPGYMIRASEISGAELIQMVPDCDGHTVKLVMDKALMPLSEARKFCRIASGKTGSPVRFPDELELRKSLTVGELPGKSFYGAAMPAANVPLFVRKSNGKIAVFDPVTMKVEPLTPQKNAALRPVIELR